MIGLIVLNIYPMIDTIKQSFYKTGDFGKGNKFVGLANYEKVFGDSEVWQALANTAKYAIVEVPFSIVIALLLAVFLNKKLKGRDAFRTIFFLPMVVAPAAIAMVWKWLYNSNFGLINNTFNIKVNWISDPKIAIFSIAVIGIWSVLGYNMVLFLAGLQEVPRDYYEAASLDGANEWQQLKNITIPLISPTIFFVVVTRIIAAMQVFDLIYMLIDLNNPAWKKTESLVFLFYKYSFEQSKKGYGATVVVVLLAVILILTVIQLIGQKKWVHYE
ncbi:MAG: sugar ABC transporter permease [Lachnospiraceae bacterium]|nr:sugar ABC transporter permease [Lachnospiraceae bacterium]